MKLSNILPLIISSILIIMLGLSLIMDNIQQNHNDHLFQKTVNFSHIQSIYGRGPINPSEEKYILHIFASWCSSCLKEHKQLLQIAQQDKIPIYGLVWHDSESRIKGWLSRYGNPYEDVGIIDHHSAIDLGITGIPETFIIGKNNLILYSYRGDVTRDMIINAIYTQDR